MPRQLSNWLDSYLEYTRDQEATEKLHFWVGISVVSAAIKRQLFMHRVRYDLYPNTYVMIVADSAAARKSVAMDIGVKLLEDAETDTFIASGTMTPEGLVRDLNRQKTIISTNIGGARVDIKTDSHFLLHMDEIAESFGYDHTRALKFTMLLTKIYGAQSRHRHTLASEKQIILENLYPVMLGGTDPVNLKVIPEEAVAGLVGRTIFVSESTIRRPIAWEEYSETDRLRIATLYSVLKSDLKCISEMKGEMIPTDGAKKLFKKWYDQRAEAMSKITDRRLMAFYNRCHDTGLKLSMIFSVCRGEDKYVPEEDVERAIKIIEGQIPEFQRVMDLSATSIYAQNRLRFIDALKRQGGAGMRRQMLRLLKMSLDEIIILENSIEAEGTAQVRVEGSNVFYKLSKDVLTE